MYIGTPRDGVVDGVDVVVAAAAAASVVVVVVFIAIAVADAVVFGINSLLLVSDNTKTTREFLVVGRFGVVIFLIAAAIRLLANRVSRYPEDSLSTAAVLFRSFEPRKNLSIKIKTY